MERVLSTEERIRRAEEVYRNKGNVGYEHIKGIPKYKNKLIKKDDNSNCSMFKYIFLILFLRKYRKFIF